MYQAGNFKLHPSPWLGSNEVDGLLVWCDRDV